MFLSVLLKDKKKQRRVIFLPCFYGDKPDAPVCFCHFDIQPPHPRRDIHPPPPSRQTAPVPWRQASPTPSGQTAPDLRRKEQECRSIPFVAKNRAEWRETVRRKERNAVYIPFAALVSLSRKPAGLGRQASPTPSGQTAPDLRRKEQECRSIPFVAKNRAEWRETVRRKERNAVYIPFAALSSSRSYRWTCFARESLQRLPQDAGG